MLAGLRPSRMLHHHVSRRRAPALGAPLWAARRRGRHDVAARWWRGCASGTTIRSGLWVPPHKSPTPGACPPLSDPPFFAWQALMVSIGT